MDECDVHALSPDERIARGRRCLDRLAGNHGIDFTESIDEDGNLVRSFRWPASSRPFRLVALLAPEPEAAADLGSIDLVLELDNRIGFLELVWDPDVTDGEWLTEVAPELYVSASDPETRAWMRDAVARTGPELARRVRDVLRTHELYQLTIRASTIEVSAIADLTWGDAEWTECAPDLSGLVAAIDAIAAIVEAQLPDTFAACAYCGARFNAAAAPSCPRCGAVP